MFNDTLNVYLSKINEECCDYENIISTIHFTQCTFNISVTCLNCLFSHFYKINYSGHSIVYVNSSSALGANKVEIIVL